MSDCRHGFEPGECAECADSTRTSRSAVAGTMAGKRFALIYAPSLRDDTFLHLNREGTHWKVRWYPSPNRPASELAQSARSSSRLPLELADVDIACEIAYPYSAAPDGVAVTDSRYWFDEIGRANARHRDRYPALG